MRPRTSARIRALIFVICLLSLSASSNADRLSYLDDACDPYYVGQSFAKLVTPQWVGEPDVEAVVILSIDDMREPAKYEAFLRPLLDRLKQHYGTAAVSIFTNAIEPSDPQLQSWLREGLSLEVHTIDHPCPLLRDGDFAKAKSTYDRCVDLMSAVPDSAPVAFRMPCCDSLNTPSPRFWTEIFDRQTPNGNYLEIDSSVFNIFTSDDPSLPEDVVKNEMGEPRFGRYLPFPSFVNTIENYPYPYIIGRGCWEFPCVVPSDWEAQNVQQPNNPDTVRDLEIALDATVIKQGVMPIVFHPHGWIRSEQLAQFVDYANERYGSKVKFLTFSDALARINEHLLGGIPLRTAAGDTHNVRLVDLNNDGYLDLFRAREARAAREAREAGEAGAEQAMARIWQPADGTWQTTQFDLPADRCRFFLRDGNTHLAYADDEGALQVLDVSRDDWSRQSIRLPRPHTLTASNHRWRDVDHDGQSELFLQDGEQVRIFQQRDGQLLPAAYRWPSGAPMFAQQPDRGLRMVDLNHDGNDDIVLSDAESYSIWLWDTQATGWRQRRSGSQAGSDAIPVIVREDGTNNGAWFHSDHLWVQNEFTSRMPDLVQRASFADLLSDSSPKDEHPLGVAQSVGESLQSFSLAEGARLEVVAAEPEVQDPVAFDWGADGKLWVAEMRDYPNGVRWHGPGDPKQDPGGRIKLLEDRDGDGRYETATVFLDGLAYPNGVKAWRNGVLISVAPNLIYAEDTDGDHVADVQRILYRGLAEGNQQHRSNGLRWGLDHWLHMANGDSGGIVQSLESQQQRDIRGRDYRVEPDAGLIELTSGQTQFGRSRDTRGNWFGGNNSDPIWHYALEESYSGRNPFYAPPSPRKQISREPGPAPVFPTSATLERFNDFDRANRFTSACSPEIFCVDRSLAVAENYRGSVFICEPVHNLVHRAQIEDDGVSFVSGRGPADRDRDFLTSSDNWFRPVMCRTGPDSALWIADMYRMVVEHPEWIPMAWQERIDHLAGFDRGRIYRVVFSQQEQPTPNWQELARMSATELVTALDTPNGSLRDMVQQQLYWRNDKAVVGPLQQLLENAIWPLAKLPALYLLEHFESLDDARLVELIRNGSSPLARHAIRLAEPRLHRSSELVAAVVNSGARIGTQEPGYFRCIQQLAYAAHGLPAEELLPLMTKIAEHHGEDDFVRPAIMSSLGRDNLSDFIERLYLGTERRLDVRGSLLEDVLSTAIAAEQRSVVGRLLASVDRPGRQRLEMLQRISAAASDRRQTLLSVFIDDDWPRVQGILAEACEIAADDSAQGSDRLLALQLLGQDPDSRQRDLDVVQRLISPRDSFLLQDAAMKAFANLADDRAVDDLIGSWTSFTPAMRAKMLDVVFSQEDWISILLRHIEQGTVLPVQVSLHHRQLLMSHANASIRSRAEQMFERAAANRQEVIDRYRSVADLVGSASRGKLVFQKQCSACHQLEGEGTPVGPDLVALGDKSIPSMLAAILDPNRAVEDKYLGYSLLTTDGLQVNGLLTHESASAISLSAVDGRQHTILRSQVDELMATGKSLMPEGLEQVVPLQSMADLLAYVRGFEAAPKQFAGNLPRVAPVRNDHSIRLFAMHAKIYGPSLIFETKNSNLGYWQNERDRAVWTIEPAAAGKYALHLIYACPPQPRSNRFQIQIHGQRVSHEVEFTDSWDDFRRQRIGVVELPDEAVELSIQSEGSIEGFLLDLQAIHLYPDH